MYKKKEEEVLNVLRDNFKCLRDLQGSKGMCKYDAANAKYVVEIKGRSARYCGYEDTMIEMAKYNYNVSRKGQKFIYAVYNGKDNCIYLWDVSKLSSSDYNFNWREVNCNKTTVFADNNKVPKMVGGLKWADAKYIYSVEEGKFIFGRD